MVWSGKVIEARRIIKGINPLVVRGETLHSIIVPRP